jgi:hypothetical protein
VIQEQAVPEAAILFLVKQGPRAEYSNPHICVVLIGLCRFTKASLRGSFHELFKALTLLVFLSGASTKREEEETLKGALRC